MGVVRTDLGWTLGKTGPGAACIQPQTPSSPRERSGTAG
ncbi:hypothetical protein Esi_0056_0005 [Ectocarpus siliculosus]|uniref:Uncharacterized protein n=1 Tax=Ectocarpus siliculosus TaxID=2880 RepID=D8LPW1_ECTSI|nr:hypothetical protein Esi_0056_0005 [Ectocarpus siliculosus]|eukprot:CBN74853.1 hypothetical protein Esi_0056_0005 [Ectocarpus siliculosus]